MITLYGIKNCDTVKKARAYLDGKLAYHFHDFKKDGLDQDTLLRWIEQAGFETIINKRGTTWRKLTDEEKALTQKDALVALILANTSLIKRPVLENDGCLLIGFDESSYDELLACC